MQKQQWFTTGIMGRRHGLPRGPWRTVEEAQASCDRWATRKGAGAGSLLAAGSARILGPFASRRSARHDADISLGPIASSIW